MSALPSNNSRTPARDATSGDSPGQPRRSLRSPALLLTGNPSSGKSTLAVAVAAVLDRQGIACEILDGDELRQRLPPSPGFARSGRRQQMERALFLAEMLASHGVIPILALVAPFAGDRALGRELFAATGWIEVHLDPPAEVCIERDSRGVYAALAARGGRHLVDTEVLDLYEPPARPALRLDTARLDVAVSAEAVVDVLLPATRPAAG